MPKPSSLPAASPGPSSLSPPTGAGRTSRPANGKRRPTGTTSSCGVGEGVSNYLTKGKQIYLEGRLQTRNYDDKDGRKVYVTEVVADDVILLSGRGEGGDMPQTSAPSRGPQRVAPPAAPSAAPAHEESPDAGGVTDDDVPF